MIADIEAIQCQAVTDIINKLGNLSVSKILHLTFDRPRASNIAPNPTNGINWELFKSRINNIKPYKGDCNMINRFIIRCEKLNDSYKPIADTGYIFECHIRKTRE